MSLDKAIAHGKEKRKPYRGAKAIDATCRNHGSCDYCKGNRTYKFRDKKGKDFSEELADMILYHQQLRKDKESYGEMELIE